jgi:hypothetical protein
MARNLGSRPQDKDEAVSHTVNWTRDLNGGTIDSVTWSTGGLTNESSTNTTTTASIRLSGGTPGQVYTVTCAITTSLGEDLEVEFTIPVNN